MKYPVAILALACAGAAGARTAPPPPPADLRQALQQYHPATVPVPRQLTPTERAMLRKQLGERPPAPHR